MRIFKHCINNLPNIYVRSKKKILYETIDFTFKPEQFYRVIVAKPTTFKLPKTTYDKQYETRDF